jgi:hypothetical protein
MGYLECQASKGFKVGDKVRVIRKVQSDTLGWKNNWAYPMDKFIGQLGEIVSIDLVNSSGISVELNGESWYFPYFVLEKVEIADKDSGEVKVKVCANLTEFDSIKSRALVIPELLRKFGKQTYTLEEVLEIIQYI